MNSQSSSGVTNSNIMIRQKWVELLEKINARVKNPGKQFEFAERPKQHDLDLQGYPGGSPSKNRRAAMEEENRNMPIPRP